MNRSTTDHRTRDGKSPTSVRLLKNPIDFIVEDHFRLRTICSELETLAEAPGQPDGELTSLIEYLTRELPQLLADEDEDLLPRVLARAEPDDELPKLARRLHAEHAEISRHLATVLPGLSSVPDDGTDFDDLRGPIGELIAAVRRHLILENAILLPLARTRLRDEDLQAMRQSMLRRRGLEDKFAT